MRSLVLLAALALALGCQIARVAAPVQDVELPYRDAAAGLGYPRPEAELLRAVVAEDEPAMRRHGWEVWAAITQPAPGGFPVFLTWYQVSEVFGETPAAGPRRFRPGVPDPLAEDPGGRRRDPELQHLRPRTA